MLDDKLPEVLDFSKDLANLEPAAKVVNYSHSHLFVVLMAIVYLQHWLNFYPDPIEVSCRGDASCKQRVRESRPGIIHFRKRWSYIRNVPQGVGIIPSLLLQVCYWFEIVFSITFSCSYSLIFPLFIFTSLKFLISKKYKLIMLQVSMNILYI